MSRAETNLAAVSDGARSSKRTELTQTATLTRSGRHLRIVVKDLSATGANGVCAFPPLPGEVVQLSFNRAILGCRVIWTRGNGFGLSFDSPLTPHQLMMLEPQNRH